jgi:lysophospholipase L1-like esterase
MTSTTAAPANRLIRPLKPSKNGECRSSKVHHHATGPVGGGACASVDEIAGTTQPLSKPQEAGAANLCADGCGGGGGDGSAGSTASVSSELSSLLYSAPRDFGTFAAPGAPTTTAPPQDDDEDDFDDDGWAHGLTTDAAAAEQSTATQMLVPPPPSDVEYVMIRADLSRDGDLAGSELDGLVPYDDNNNINHRNDDASHDGSSLTRRLVRQWVLRGMLAPAAAAYAAVPALHWTTLLASAFFAPVLAIVQGSLGILQFRVRFGQAPVPIAPSHGVVFARQQQQQQQQKQSSSCTNDAEEEEALNGIENDREPWTGSNYASTQFQVPRPGVGDGAAPARSIDDARHLSPVRLLVIGDSLAIGVGQRHSAFPVLPSAIARTLSAKLGRVVYWTCHGAPGASTGWIVRELERGVSTPDTPAYNGVEDAMDAAASSSSSPSDKQPISRQSSSASSSDGSYAISDPPDAAAWRGRLTAHRKRFNPDRLGPYDIVVVLTGSNDLKSAFFPFLLTGEDAEFRRQAQERGGNYNKELRRLVETLYDKMKIQFQTLRESIQTGVDQVLTHVEAATESVRERVEQATETVRERVEETMERILIPVGSSNRTLDQLLPSFPARKSPRAAGGSGVDVDPSAESSVACNGGGGRTTTIDASSTTSTDDSAPDDGYDSVEEGDACDGAIEKEVGGDACDDEASVQRGHSRHYPLVVLPGMPSRALPIFGTVPLRWLACPIVDIMDRHKHDLAANHPGHVLFVPAPGLEQVRTYESRTGVLWRERSHEDVVLNLHDPPRTPAQDAELELSIQQYYGARTSWTVWKQSGLFAEDQIHPNDEGYDFWGRYIGRAIYLEWKNQQQQ